MAYEKLKGRIPDDVIAYLEDRDRELETYLDQLAGGTIAVTAVTQSVFAPSAHAPTHNSFGSDPLTAADVGAATPAQVAVVQAAADAAQADADAAQLSADDAQDDIDAHLIDTIDAHDASAVSFVPGSGIAATQVQAAIEEAASDTTAHLTDTVDAHDASAVSFAPAGTIAATDVQAAIEEVAAEAAGGSGHTIQEEGTPLTARTGLNFTGAGVQATDDAGNDRTNVTIGGRHAIKDEGVVVTDRSSINFQGAGVTVTQDGTEIDVVIPATATINGHTIEDEGTPVAQRGVLNFTGAGVAVADDGSETDVTIPGETLPVTLADAKGDLLVATAADVFARLAVGANGLSLVADSGAASGVEWSSVVTVQEVYSSEVNASVNTTATEVATGTVTLPAGWDSMDILLLGVTLVTPSVSTAVRLSCWLEAPDGTQVGLKQGSAMSGNTNFYDATPMFAVVAGRTADTSVSMNAQVTSGSNGDANADNRQIIALKLRKS